MNKYIKYFLLLVVLAAVFTGGYFLAFKTVKADKVVTEVVKDRFTGLTPAHLTTDGHSMEPTLSDKTTYQIYKIDPQEGDIISLVSPKFTSSGAVKRLINIREDGAWWVLGDNRTNSHDSGDFGWILPSERSNVWVVKVK